MKNNKGVIKLAKYKLNVKGKGALYADSIFSLIYKFIAKKYGRNKS
tara:strand:- start:354 stop:491 length:138 start_codon:yes stop_codon:yes gene_type:complete